MRALSAARARLAACAAVPVLLAATPVGLAAQPVVQATPAFPAGQTLNAALGRLARDPRDLVALIDAGNAALQMGDIDAATGFFARADQISPGNMRIKAGLAAALVRSENPYDAIPLFAEAERAGAVDPALAADRGLAYDLVGDTTSAQKYYRQALAAGPNDEALRRLALSQAIAGDRRGMEASLSPLLQRQDKAAWRARAFGLAILGAPEEGVAIANQTMPAELANGIAPYLRFMPRLTAAQQAAAANLGRFPRAADVGRDDPRVALYAPPRQVAATVGSALVPAGEPLGKGQRQDRRQQQQAQQQAQQQLPPAPAQRVAVATAVRTAPPEVVPARSNYASPEAMPARSALAPTRPTPQLAPQPAPQLAVVPAPPPVQTTLPPARSAAPTAMVSGNGFDLARVAPAAPSAPAPAPAVAPAPAAVPPPAPTPPPAAAPIAPTLTRSPAPPPPAPRPRARSLADAFADLAVVPRTPVAPAPGAVDVRKLAKERAKAAEAAKVPPKPAHPSRIWVQVGTGRDTGALGFTWRGLVKDNPGLFKGQSASISDWGRTNRLLAGPFATEAAADAFLAKARKADLDAFVWTSPAGQVVDALPGR